MSDAELIRRFAARAMQAAGDLPHPDAAELYQAAALVLEKVDPPAADLARHTAMLLREAERHQLHFRELLTHPASPAPEPVTPAMAAAQRPPFGPAD